MNNGKTFDTIIPATSLHYSNSVNNIIDNVNVNMNINNKIKNNNNNNVKNKKNKNITTSATYYHFPRNLSSIEGSYLSDGNNDICLKLEETLLLEKSTASGARSATIINENSNASMGLLIHKSNSDGIMLKPKMTIIKQNEYNGCFNTSIHNNNEVIDNNNDNDDSDYRHGIMKKLSRTSSSGPAFCTRQLNNLIMVNNCDNAAVTIEENEAFLNYQGIHETTNAVNSDITITTTATSSTTTIATQTTKATATTISLFNINNRRYNRSHRNNHNNHSSNKSQRYAICYRLHTCIAQNNLYLNYLVPFLLLIGLIFIAYLTRDYAKRLLYWIELQNHWIIFFMFMIFFIIVSFPIVVGYFVLMITAGYLFGFTKGLLTVILGANLGIFVAHLTLRNIRHRIPIQKIIKNETGRAILRVISGPRAFRVVLFTRLTPIPFGLQNTIFGISSINTRLYHIATFLGLLPAQIINVYLGSTLRSMHEVLNTQGTALTGYISFGIEVICGIALMCWVVRKARKELSNTLLTNLDNDNRLIDIQV